jgi:retron-type reverse transcriptase
LNLNNARTNANSNIGFRPRFRSLTSQKAGRYGARSSARSKGCQILAARRKNLSSRRVVPRREACRLRHYRDEMKTHTHLFEHVVTFDALHAAYLRARRGKRRAWPCRSFERDLEGNLIQLQNELIWGQYRIGGYRSFEVHEPKTRTITALVEFRDRVVQHALMAVLEPLWEASFINASFACRVGKGTHAGADHAQAMMRDCLRRHGSLYALKADVRKYFASINHATLKRLLRRKIADRQVLAILDGIIDSYSEPATPGCGIPIGNLTSQLMANIYLDALDQHVKCRRREKWYARYMDDFIVLHPDKRHLQALRLDLERWLGDELQLELNHKTGVFPVATHHGRGLDFLGYHLWPHKRRLRKASLKRFKRRVRRLQRQYAARAVDLPHIKQQLASWLAHARHGDAVPAVAKFLDQHPFRRNP